MLDAFEIDDGVLKVGRAAQYINYEKSDVISVLINTRDSGDPSYDTSRLVHLVIENADDPPSDISLSNSVVRCFEAIRIICKTCIIKLYSN